MKKNNKLLILLGLFIPILISIGFAAWIITYEIIFIPEETKIEVVNDLTYRFNDKYEFPYDGEEHWPSPIDPSYDTSNLIFEYTLDGIVHTENGPINTGDYEVKIFKKDNENCYKITNVKITQAEPQIIRDPIIPAFVIGEERIFSGGAAVGVKDEAVSGVFSFNDEKVEYAAINRTNIDAKVTMKFTPTGSFAINYSPITFTVNTTIISVAYIKETNYYYGTIEDALNKAANNQTVVVRLFSEVGSNPVIRNNCEVKSGVTLCLPYEGTTWNGYATGSAYEPPFADSNSSKIAANKKLEVRISKEVTLTNNGTIQIGGVTGQTAQRLAGHTTGSYAQITMEENSNIISNGVITCYGYIKESSKDNESQVLSRAGYIYMPFVVHDYRGGASTVGAYAGDGSLLTAGNRKGVIAPFNVFSFPNIQTKLVTYYSSSIIGCADLYTGEMDLKITKIPAQHNTTNINIIGSNNSIINIKAGGRVEIKYNESFDSNGNGITNEKSDTTTLNLYGGATTGALSMKIDFGSSVTITTKDVFFPVAWLYDINLYDGDYEIKYKTKFLTGSSLKVNEDASLTIGAETIFYQEFNDVAYGGISYPNKDKARCIINGKLTSNSPLGGYIETESSKVFESLLTINNISSVTSKEGYGARNQLNVEFHETNSITLSATWKLLNNGVETTSFNTGIYISYRGTDYFEDASNIDHFQYTIIFKSNSSDAKFSNGTSELTKTFLSLAPITINISNFEEPVREYYIFAGWYFINQENNEQSLDGYNISEDMTIEVYAKWQKHEYNITYIIKNMDEEEGFDDSSELLSTTFTYDSKITFSKYAVDDYNFYGWYLDSEYTILLDLNREYTGEELIRLTINDVLILYGFVTKQNAYTINFDLDTDEILKPIVYIGNEYKITDVKCSEFQDFINNCGIEARRTDEKQAMYWTGRLFYERNGEKHYFNSIESLYINGYCFEEGRFELTIKLEYEDKYYIEFKKSETDSFKIYFIGSKTITISEIATTKDKELGETNKKYFAIYQCDSWKEGNKIYNIGDIETFLEGNHLLEPHFEVKEYYVEIKVEITKNGGNLSTAPSITINNSSVASGASIIINLGDKTPSEDNRINITIKWNGEKGLFGISRSMKITISYEGLSTTYNSSTTHNHTDLAMAYNGTLKVTYS